MKIKSRLITTALLGITSFFTHDVLADIYCSCTNANGGTFVFGGTHTRTPDCSSFRPAWDCSDFNGMDIVSFVGNRGLPELWGSANSCVSASHGAGFPTLAYCPVS